MLWITVAILVVGSVWMILKGRSLRRAALGATIALAERDDQEPARESPTDLRGVRLKPTAANRRDGYWRSPPVPTADTEAMLRAVADVPPARRDVCFTGWSDEEKAELQQRATLAGLKVRMTVANNLLLLCVGEGPGPRKVTKAIAVGAMIISGAQLELVIHALPEA